MMLSGQEFRDHMDGMISSGQIKQAMFWAENGTLIYSNYDELMSIYDEEYRDQVES